MSKPVLLAKNIPSPSPDKRAANRIRTTNSPCKEIERYITDTYAHPNKKNNNKAHKQQQDHNRNYHNPSDLQKIRSLE